MEGASTLVGKVGNLGGQAGQLSVLGDVWWDPQGRANHSQWEPQAQTWLDLRWGVWKESEQEAPQPRDLEPGRTWM